MTFRRTLLAASMALTLAPLAGFAQTSPLAGPVRVTSVFPAGAGPDAVMRLLMDKLPALLGQPLVLEARPGASGFIAAQAVKGAAATGQELLLADVGTLATNMSLFRKVPYDSERDFTPVALIYRTSFILAVSATSPYKTVGELMAAAASAPEKVSYMSNGAGSPLHLGAAQIEAAAGVRMLHIPFKELAPGLAAVVNNEVTWVPTTLGSGGALLRAGKIRLMAVMDSKRNPALPEVPTLAEAGGPKGVEAVTWVALMAPRGTPAAAVNAINHAVNQVLAQPEVAARFATFGFQPAPATPAQLGELLSADIKRHAELVKRTGASVD